MERHFKRRRQQRSFSHSVLLGATGSARQREGCDGETPMSQGHGSFDRENPAERHLGVPLVVFSDLFSDSQWPSVRRYLGLLVLIFRLMSGGRDSKVECFEEPSVSRKWIQQVSKVSLTCVCSVLSFFFTLCCLRLLRYLSTSLSGDPPSYSVINFRSETAVQFRGHVQGFEGSTLWNSFIELERLRNKRVDVWPLLRRMMSLTCVPNSLRYIQFSNWVKDRV